MEQVSRQNIHTQLRHIPPDLLSLPGAPRVLPARDPLKCLISPHRPTNQFPPMLVLPGPKSGFIIFIWLGEGVTTAPPTQVPGGPWGPPQLSGHNGGAPSLPR